MFLGKESLSTVSCGICTHTPDPLLGKKNLPHRWRRDGWEGRTGVNRPKGRKARSSPQGREAGSAPLASKICPRGVSLRGLDSRSSEGSGEVGPLDTWDPASFCGGGAGSQDLRNPWGPRGHPPPLGGRDLMGVKGLELWAGSSCEPKAGNAPQESSSHS